MTAEAHILRRVLRIQNARGLHARASAKFVECVKGFKSDVRVSREGTTVGGDSIMGLMMLAASLGADIEVVIEGADAEKAMHAIETLVNAHFYDDDPL